MTEFVYPNSQQLNHFLKAQESELPFSHKSVVSIRISFGAKHLSVEDNYLQITLVGYRPMKMKEKIY